MCSADLAMEPHEQTDPDDNGPLDGSWNGHHVCKAYEHVMPYLEGELFRCTCVAWLMMVANGWVQSKSTREYGRFCRSMTEVRVGSGYTKKTVLQIDNHKLRCSSIL